MIDLAQTYERAGLFLAPGELPDYLPVVLEFVSTQPPREGASSWARSPTSSIRSSARSSARQPLRQRDGRLLDLAGERRGPSRRAEPTLDESWAEPAAFEGCSLQGQAKPGDPSRSHRSQPGTQAQGASS